MWGRLHVKTTQIPPFVCCIPVFQSFLSIYYFILCKCFTLAKKIRWSAGHRCIFICIFFFSCSSDSGPSKEDFMKRVQIPDDEEAKCQRWWRTRKQEIAWASCVRVVFISRTSSTQSVKEILWRRIEQKRVQQNEESFSRSQDNATLSNWASILSNLTLFLGSAVDNCCMRQNSRCLLSLWSLNSQESGSSSLEISSELPLPEVFSKHSHCKRPKLTVIPVIRRGQGCTLRFRPLYNRNNSDGKASLKWQWTPETTTDIKDVSKFYWFNV